MTEMAEMEERPSIDEKPSIDTYESHVHQEGDQTQEDWRGRYRGFLWTDADVRARFERAEYFLLHNREFGEILTEAHSKSKNQLWALRQQMYEGNCMVSKAGVVDQYRYPDLVLKRRAWMKETNKPPRECAVDFEALIRVLDPEYMHWTGYPSGPMQQVKAALRLQTSFRSWTSVSDMMRQKRIKTQITKLRTIAKTVLLKEDSKASLVRMYTGFNAFEDADGDGHSEPFTTPESARTTCVERKCGGFVVHEGRVYFRQQSAWCINKDKHRFRAGYDLYVIQDAEMDKQEKVNELWDLLSSGKIITKYGFTGKKSTRTMWLDKDVYRICIGHGTSKGSEKAKGLYITDICEVRQGPRTTTFGNVEPRVSSPAACLSLIGSERTIDVEFKDAAECDFFAERFTLLMDSINDEKTRYRLYERHLLTQTGWRKSLSFSEAVDMKLAQDELTGGITVLKYNKRGRTRPCQIKLDQALLKNLSLGEENRRPRLFLADGNGEEQPMADSKGIDLADISEVRPGIRTCNFNAAKGQKDLKKVENLCFSIVGSERTLSLELIDGTPGQLERLVKGLRLLVFGCPRLLGNLERDDQEVAEIIYHAKPWISSVRNNCKLRPKFERDEEELATAEAVSSATMKALSSTTDEFEVMLTQEQTQTYTKAFELFDKDHSNAIDASELHKAMHSLGKRISPEEAMRMISEYDDDGDEEIGVEEFLKMMGRSDNVQNSLAGIGEVFQVFDEDGDGCVTHDEFRQVLVSYNDGLSEMLTSEQIDKLIEMIDTDGDGQIDHGEFTSFLIATMTD